MYRNAPLTKTRQRFIWLALMLFLALILTAEHDYITAVFFGLLIGHGAFRILRDSRK